MRPYTADVDQSACEVSRPAVQLLGLDHYHSLIVVLAPLLAYFQQQCVLRVQVQVDAAPGFDEDKQGSLLLRILLVRLLLHASCCSSPLVPACRGLCHLITAELSAASK